LTEVSMGEGKTLEEKKIVTEQGERRIVIIPRYCKGCEICVKLCPKSVLEIKSFKASVVRIEDCIECMQCEIRCPDFAIEVYGSGRKGSGE
jgi:2-oxoglutarate ferredoxin oxidoreductase subunit delta